MAGAESAAGTGGHRSDAVQRYVYQPLRSGDRHSRGAGFGTRWLPCECGAAWVLRASLEIARAVGRGASPCGDSGEWVVSDCESRREDIVLRTELFVGGEGRRAFAAAGRSSGTGK